MATKIREIEEPEVPVPVRQLIVGSRLPCDMYIKENKVLKLFFSKDIIYTKISQDVLAEKGISNIYIYERDVSAFDFYLSANRSLKIREANVVSTFKEYAHCKEQHYQIDSTLLKPGTEVNFSLFVLNKLDLSLLLDASAEYPAVVEDNLSNFVGDIVIKKADVNRYLQHISDLSSSVGLPGGEDAKIKAVALREFSKIVLQNFLDNPRSGEKLKEINVLVNNMIDCILTDNDAIYTLLSMKGYDYYTYTHSVNVAALSLSLGVAMGLKRDDVEKLGIGAILHDAGKSAISHEILNKQGKLDSVEYNILKSHVIEGEKIMLSHKNIPAQSLSAVLQHHERLTGKGYPFGLSGKEIKLFGRISAIADCYDALTTRRPYKAAFSPFYALLMISKETGHYDPDLLKIFIKMLGKIK